MKFSNTAVAILFFGLALLEAVKNHNWLEAILFAAIGALSLRADLRKK